jgi:hypothetical protein
LRSPKWWASIDKYWAITDARIGVYLSIKRSEVVEL